MAALKFFRTKLTDKVPSKTTRKLDIDCEEDPGQEHSNHSPEAPEIHSVLYIHILRKCSIVKVL